MRLPSPRTWWQAGLMWGTALFAYYFIKDAIHGDITLARAAKEFLKWEAGGLLFGILLTGVLSLLSRKNLFRGFPDRPGDR
jgi:hypothetical protein